MPRKPQLARAECTRSPGSGARGDTPRPGPANRQRQPRSHDAASETVSGRAARGWPAWTALGCIARRPDHASRASTRFGRAATAPHAPLKEAMARAAAGRSPSTTTPPTCTCGAMGSSWSATGCRQYEISNVAKPGAESRHNLAYWEDGEWSGSGAARIQPKVIWHLRWKNVSATEDYIQRVVEGRALPVETRRLTALERAEEALFTGLRLAGGVATSWRSARVRSGRLGIAPRRAWRLLHRGGDGPREGNRIRPPGRGCWRPTRSRPSSCESPA